MQKPFASVIRLLAASAVCMLAGAAQMPPLVFYALNLGGTIAAIAIFRAFGDVFGGPISAVTGFLNDYRWPLIALSAVLVGLNAISQRRRGSSELESVSELRRWQVRELGEDFLRALAPHRLIGRT